MTTGSRRTLPFVMLAVTGALALSACSSSAGAAGGGQSVASSPSTTGSGGGAGATPGGGQNGTRQQPGVSGLVAAVTGTTMQVQTRTDQTAVSWTGTTAFSQLVPASLADVTVGACVTVTQPASSSTAGSPTTAPTQVTAGSVQLRQTTNGTCAGGPGGGGDQAGGGKAGGGKAGGKTATPAPGSGATGQGANRSGRGFGVTGQVTAVNGSTFTVQETARPEATTAPVSPSAVTTTSSTTYLKQAPASASDVTVGECATAIGTADETGSVAATTITLRPATNGACTTDTGGRAGAGPSGQTTTGATRNG